MLGSSRKIHTLCVFGTRPEAIKMAPLIKELSLHKTISNKVCTTGQHKEMLNSVLQFFDISPDFELDVMTANQTLCGLTNKILKGLDILFKQYRPELLLVHGDTTSTLAASLAAYYHKIPIAHIEAGLRTGNIYSPWPEEVNRKLTGNLALYHFAPTKMAKNNLLLEGINEKHIYVTGNTVIDALIETSQKIASDNHIQKALAKQFEYINKYDKLILVTGHRRENFGAGFENICNALGSIARKYPNIGIIYPVHLNPSVQEPANRLLNNIDNMYLISPVDYVSFIYLMMHAHIILTDSGGIQEEAPSLGKPVLVMRDITERPEAIDAGTTRLIGTDKDNIIANISALLESNEEYNMMSQAQNPYGQGDAAQKIVRIIVKNFQKKSFDLIKNTKHFVTERSLEKNACTQ